MNCILEFPQTHIKARFLSHIDNFGSSLDDRYLESIKRDGVGEPALVFDFDSWLPLNLPLFTS
jgi:hypothetical protein